MIEPDRQPGSGRCHLQVLRSRQAVANHKRKEPPVLKQVAEGVLIHESEFLQSNAVVVHGRAGVALPETGAGAVKG